MSIQRTPIHAILFDLDDTLNNRDASWMAFVRMLTGRGGQLGKCSLNAVHAAILAADRGGYRPKDQLFNDLRDRLPWRSPLTAESIEQIWRRDFPGCMVVREGVHEALSSLRARGLRTAIVTNGRSDIQRAKIEQMGIGSLVDIVITSEEIGVKKPEAGIFQSALSALGVTAQEALFVGDNPRSDVAGPAAIGIRTVWLANGRDWPLDDVKPDYCMDAFSELDAVIVAAGGG